MSYDNFQYTKQFLIYKNFLLFFHSRIQNCEEVWIQSQSSIPAFLESLSNSAAILILQLEVVTSICTLKNVVTLCTLFDPITVSVLILTE